MDADRQANMVNWVRRKIHYGGMIDNPITIRPDDRFSSLQKNFVEHGWTFTSFPVVDENNKLLGLLTRDDMDFVEGKNPLIKELMKKRDIVVTCNQDTDSERAYQIMLETRVKKLPMVDKDDRVIGMYVWGDVKNDHRTRDSFSLDSEGHFLVGAAIGLGADDINRAELLVNVGCKVLVIDCSHGACKPAKLQIEALRKKFGEKVDIIVGNIASYESAVYLLEGEYIPDALKVGIGPGSICTTRRY
eukprot:TRINITY_DN10413_c0_g3_i1.p1 TRINITY_DN10413_c0_g3~~TRINITY_DN10413_c0_g3_i1.p1  ORF type:complete len:285 (-),score=44.31 TRINITY_DN10413_c0_g3_i1:77-814(-)